MTKLDPKLVISKTLRASLNAERWMCEVAANGEAFPVLLKVQGACPVERETRQVVEISRNMARAIRRLRSSLRACKNCRRSPRNGANEQECPFLRDLNAQVREAVAAVWEEFQNTEE